MVIWKRAFTLGPWKPHANFSVRYFSEGGSKNKSLFHLEYNFTEEKLHQRFESSNGGIRIGRIFEELDLAAGAVAYEHIGEHGFRKNLSHIRGHSNTKSLDLSHIIVTASCDSIKLLSMPSLDNSLHLYARPVWVGRSSIEIELKMRQKEQEILSGNFVMVCRSKSNQAATFPPLKIETEEELELFRKGEASYQRRKRLRESHDKPAFSIHELTHLSQFTLQNQLNASALNRPQDTLIESTRWMHPDKQNIHGKIFGGYLMREAFEIGYTCASLWSRSALIKFEIVDEISFLYPVEVGDIASFRARVIVVDENNNMKIMVECNVINPVTGIGKTTNVFWMAFKAIGDTKVRPVVPVTLEEGIRYLESRYKAQCLS